MFWNSARVEHLKKMMAAGLSLSQMAEVLGTTKGSIVGKRARILGFKDPRIGVRVRKRAQCGTGRERKNGWSKEDFELALSLKSKGYTCKQIGRRVGRTACAVHTKLQRRDYTSVVHEVELVDIPEFVLAEREHRLSLPYRDLTASLLGDPVKGYSALDRRHLEAA